MASKELENEKEKDLNSSEGHIELRIENLTGFLKEKINSKRRSTPVYVRGVAWKILARLLETNQPAQNSQKQKCLGYFLECNDRSTDPFWSYFASFKQKIVAQKEGKIDFVREINHIFYADKPTLGFAPFMTFEELMNPNKGFYDEQTDSILLKIDFAGVGEYVVVAQNELKLDKVPIRFSIHFAQMEWEVNFNAGENAYNKNVEKSVVLCCKDLVKGKDQVDKMLLVELFAYGRDDSKQETYSAILRGVPPLSKAYLHLFTSKDNTMTAKIPNDNGCNNILTTVRVWKERSQFPDFTKPTAMVGRFPANVTLRVGDKIFHVNKLLLSSLSQFFDRMYNGDYDAARQQEVELSLSTQSAEAFHHFLIVLCINDALPNSMNVVELYKLADFYDAENIRQKCNQHLRMAREMAIEDRMLLARDHDSKETQALIVDSANLVESKALNIKLLEHRCPKK